jgi:hypothetical protein
VTDLVPSNQAPAAQAAAPHPYEDEQMRRLLRRNQITAAVIARMPGLNKSLVGETIQETQANVEAVGLTLATYGVGLNAINVNQFDQIPPDSGQMVPRCQLLMALVSELTGDEIWPDDACDDKSATVYLRRADTGREYKSTYTVEMARRSHALDFWFTRWAKTSTGKSYPAEKVIVGTSETEAFDREKWPKWAEGEPQSNPFWHNYREDALMRRAFKRVIKNGRPGVTAGVLVFDQAPVLPPPAGATVTVAMDYDDEGEDAPALGAGPVVAPEQAPAEVVDAAKGIGGRIIRLDRQLRSLPADWIKPLWLAWEAKGLPELISDDFGPQHLDAAEEVVDKITAEALRTADAEKSEGAASRTVASGESFASGRERTLLERAAGTGAPADVSTPPSEGDGNGAGGSTNPPAPTISDEDDPGWVDPEQAGFFDS